MRTSRVTSTPERRRSRISSPARPSYSDRSLRRRCQTTIAERRDGVLGGRGGDHELARQLDFVAGPGSDEAARQPPAVEAADLLEDLFDGVDGVLGQIDRGRLHLHHPPPGDIDRQGHDVVDVRVRDRASSACP